MKLIKLPSSETTKSQVVPVGWTGQNEYEEVTFDISAWLKRFPTGIVRVFYKLNTDVNLYPIADITSDTYIWKPQAADFPKPGRYSAQAIMESGTTIGKSDIFYFDIKKSLDHLNQISDDPPPEYPPSYIQKIMQDMEALAQRAESAAEHIPYYEDGKLYVWDEDTQQFVEFSLDIDDAVEKYFDKHPITITETDPTVPEWAKQPEKPSYTAEEVGSLPVINVKKYGAKGDGTTDDTAAIAQAITAVAIGGTLYFPAGTYRVSNITLKSNMNVCGDGDTSVIQLIDGLTGTTYQNCLTVNDVSNVIIRRLKLDGKRSAQSSTGAAQDQRLNGIHLKNASDVRIENVWLYNNGYHGIIGVNCARVQVCNCKSTDNGFRPIHFHSGCIDISIVENTCLNNGLGLTGGSGNLYDGIYVFGVERCVIAGNTVLANRAGCISASGTEGTVGLSITGNTLICTARLAPDTTIGTGSVGSCGVYLASSGLVNFALSGNTIRNAYRGVFLYGDSSGSMEGGAIVGNSIDDCTIAFDVELNVNAVNISGNTITNALEKALATVRCKNLRFAENAIAFSAESQTLTTTCISLYATDDCQVANNKVEMASHYRYGVRVYGTASGYTGAGNIIMDNVLNGAAVNAILFETDGNVQRSNWVNGVNDTPIPAAVTEQTVAGWGFTKNTGTYSKPSGGIPKTDLAQAVRTSLGKADTALQEHQSLSGYATESWVQNQGYLIQHQDISGKADKIPRIAKASTDTTPTLDPNKLYVFPEMASLTPTLNAPSDNSIVNEYHFIFTSGATATVLTLPASVLQPDGFTVEANMHYEISILEGAMTAQGWAVST